jgi:hemerythrin
MAHPVAADPIPELPMKIDPPDAFSWHDGFLLGYPAMDGIHEEFVTLVEALRCAPNESIADALDAVAVHLREHFDTENRWMLETDFPARDCHIEEHAAVIRSTEGVQRRMALGDRDAARRLALALIDWFPAHADYLDAALAHWICKLRLGGQPVVIRRRIESLTRATAR